MSAQATFWAWEVEVDSVHERAVLLCLADCHNGDTGQCNPSVAFVARKTRCDRKTVMKVIAELTKKKLIKPSKSRGTSTQYTLLTSTANGTSTAGGTSTNEGTTPVPPEGHPPVPQAVPKPKREPKKNLEDNAYAFCGETIKLNQEDFDKAKSQYRNLNLVETLRQLDMELREDKKWWGTMHAKLNYRNRNHAGNRPQGNQQGSSTQKLSAVERVRQLGQQREAELDRQLAEIERQRASHQAPEGYDPSVVSSQ